LKLVAERAAIQPDEIRTLTSYTSTHRWAAIWALIFTTGMRRGEVLGLRWSDVDLDAGTITIRSTRTRYGTTIDTSTPRHQRQLAGTGRSRSGRLPPLPCAPAHVMPGDDKAAAGAADELLAAPAL